MSSDAQALAVVRRTIEAYNRGDVHALRELYAPDHIEHPLWHAPLPQPGSDDQPVLDRYEQTDDFPDFRLEIDEQFAHGDRVVTIWHGRGTHAKSGRGAEFRGIFIDRVADGKLAESWVSQDQLGVFQQLGAVEPSRDLAERVDRMA